MENTIIMDGMEFIKEDGMMYTIAKDGVSLFNGQRVEVIGEQLLREKGTENWLNQYLYNIVGYTPENGKPFASIKENIMIQVPFERIEK